MCGFPKIVSNSSTRVLHLQCIYSDLSVSWATALIIRLDNYQLSMEKWTILSIENGLNIFNNAEHSQHHKFFEYFWHNKCD